MLYLAVALTQIAQEVGTISLAHGSDSTVGDIPARRDSSEAAIPRLRSGNLSRHSVQMSTYVTLYIVLIHIVVVVKGICQFLSRGETYNGPHVWTLHAPSAVAIATEPVPTGRASLPTE